MRTSNLFLVDGGYIKWIYGVQPDHLSAWSASSEKYRYTSGGIICMDSAPLGRLLHDPSYKSRRVEKRDANPEKQQRANYVKYFEDEILLDDPRLFFVSHPLLEADDIIALASLCSPVYPIKVVGVDKDLLQLPWDKVHLYNVRDERIFVSKFKARLPISAAHYVRKNEDVLLALALLGDKSDSVPRLIPPRRLDIFSHIMMAGGTMEKFDTALRICKALGMDFLNNLYLTILPGPWCFDPIPTPEEVFSLARQGLWAASSHLAIQSNLRSKIEDIYNDSIPLHRE